jgi:hypothetical protein
VGELTPNSCPAKLRFWLFLAGAPKCTTHLTSPPSQHRHRQLSLSSPITKTSPHTALCNSDLLPQGPARHSSSSCIAPHPSHPLQIDVLYLVLSSPLHPARRGNCGCFLDTNASTAFSISTYNKTSCGPNICYSFAGQQCPSILSKPLPCSPPVGCLAAPLHLTLPQPGPTQSGTLLGHL